MKAYWYNRRPNFGDQLTPLIFEAIAGVKVEWAEPKDADVFAAGSILGRVPRDFRGIVIGTGAMYPKDRDALIRAKSATVLALRGPLSGKSDLYADPGLMARLFSKRAITPTHKVGIVAHYADVRLRTARDGHVIDVSRPPLEVFAAISRCATIRSSSLHGLIVADALGIPNRWEPSPFVLGDGFKFRDYAASFEQKIEPNQWREVPHLDVLRKIDALVARWPG